MVKNIGSADRIIRLILGVILIALGIGSINPVLMIAGIFSVYEAVSSWCVFYAILGRNTCPLKKKKSTVHVVFLNGIIILLTAIVLNFIAQSVGIETWYGLLENAVVVSFFPALKALDLFASIFLFFLYPFLLGTTSFLFLKHSLKN